MKKLILFTFLFAISQTPAIAVSPTPTRGVTPTQTPAVSQSVLSSQINNLKDRIASRVAQLKLVEKRGIIGTVTDVSLTQVTISDTQHNPRVVDIDEFTKFSSSSASTSFGISDVKKGMKLSVIGLYNKESHQILARQVAILTQAIVLSGIIDTIDTKNFQFKLLTTEKETYTIDVVSTTKTASYTNADGLTKSGFSKLREGQRAMVIGFVDSSKKLFVTGQHVILFPSLPLNPHIPYTNDTQDSTVSISPSSSLSPKPTIKPTAP